MDWAAGSDRSGSVEELGAVVQIHMALSLRLNQSRLSHCEVQAMQCNYIDIISRLSLTKISVELRTIGVFGLGRLASLDDCST